MGQIDAFSEHIHDDDFDDEFPFDDEVSYDDDFDEFPDGSSISRISWMSATGRSRLFCFHCNRPESHYNSLKGRWYYMILKGMTFGLVKFYGPYRCRCCGHRRLFSCNRYHPKFIYRQWQIAKASEKDKKRY
jgi:hypothetical protein